MAKAKKTTKQKNEESKNPNLAEATISKRGRIFEGTVVKKFPKRVVIEFERTVFVRKYERFYKKKTRLHARLPDGIDVNIGDYIQVSECRPLSKIIHFIVIGKIRSADAKEAKQ